jgi:Fic family protein
MDLPAGVPRLSHQWHPVSDLPGNFDSLRDRELEFLFEGWAKEKGRMEPAQIASFTAELTREWAIETGIIEGVYTLDRGITQTLIERGINSSYISHDSTNRDPELVARIIQTHADVLEGLFAFVLGERVLSVGYVKELHAALLSTQDTVVVFDQFGNPFESTLEKGKYKILPNNPKRPDGLIHEFCPPEHVASEMDRLVNLHHEHNSRGIAAQIEAAWLHHAFTQIHPFQDGNGRVARALASLVLIKRGFFPFVVTRDDRERYILALEAADEGDLMKFVNLVSQIQKRSLTKAIGRTVDIQPMATIGDAVAAIRNMLVNIGRMIPEEYLRVKSTAQELVNVALSQFNSIANTLSNDVTKVDAKYYFTTRGGTTLSADKLSFLAEHLKYDPNPDTYNEAISLLLKAGDVESRIVLAIHGVGSAFRGLLVAACYFVSGNSDPIMLSDDLIRFSYQESSNQATKRFTAWFEPSVIQGLAQWRKTLF